MSPWHSGLIAIFLFAQSPVSSFAVDTSRGPVNQEEGDLLWFDGREAALSGRCADAVTNLSRLVDRYAGHQGYIEAHLLLGECLLKLGDAKAAIAPLRYFSSGAVSETGAAEHALAQRGRVLLARAYLGLAKYHEAYLGSLEIVKHARTTEGAAPEATALEAVLIKTRALIGMKQDIKAEAALGTVQGSVTPASPASLRAETSFTRMKLAAYRCTKLPGKGRMDEAQARNQIERRGSCMLEATVLAHEALLAGDPLWGSIAEAEAREASSGFGSACTSPPDPPADKHGKRSAQDLKKYRSELTDILTRDCAKTLKGALEMLDGWRKDVPKSTAPFLGSMRDAYATELKRLVTGKRSG